METLIMPYKYLLSLLTISQTTQFHEEMLKMIREEVATVSPMSDLMSDYESTFQKLESAYNDSQKSFETEFIAGKDVSRDSISTEIIRRVNFAYNNPVDEEEHEYARLLKFETDKYQDALRKDYKTDTGASRNFAIDLRKNTAAINRLGINELLERLVEANAAFEQLYIARTEALEAKRKRGPIGILADKCNASFNRICMSAVGLIISRPSAAMKSTLQVIINHVNAQIHDYTTISHRHASVLAKRRKKRLQAKAKQDAGSNQRPSAGNQS